MTQKNIILACSAGMSTSMLVTRLRKEAENKNYDYHIYAVPTMALEEELDKNEISAIFLGPQVAFQANSIKETVGSRNIPIRIIDTLDYGMMKADKIIEDIYEAVNSK